MKRHLKKTLSLMTLALLPVFSMATELTADIEIDATEVARNTPDWVASLKSLVNTNTGADQPLTSSMFETNNKPSTSDSNGEYFASLKDQEILNSTIRQQKAASFLADTGLGYDPNYVPGCTELSTNTMYTLNSTTTGVNECFYFDVPLDSVRIEVDIIEQTAGNNHDLIVAQDDPNNPYTLPVLESSLLPSNANERVSYINDAGHYYLILDPVVSNGDPFKFAFLVTQEFDDYEINDSLSNPTSLTEGEDITANIDTRFDYDLYEYVTIGTELYIHNEFNPNFHSIGYSIDNGINFYVLPADNVINVPAPGTKVMLLVLAPSTISNPAVEYVLGVYDDKGTFIGNLSGLTLSSQSSTGIDYGTQHIPGFYINGYHIPGGVVGNRLRFFAQIWLDNGEPAKYRSLDFEYYLPAIGYIQESIRTNGLGHLDETIDLPSSCAGNYEEVESGFGSDPDKHFIFDLGTFQFTAEIVNGITLDLNGQNINDFFNLCHVHNEEVYLNPFTYEPY